MKHLLKNMPACKISLLLILLGFVSCQDFDRPEMVLIPDPSADALKYYLSFDNNEAVDGSIYKFPVEAKGITFTDGIQGTAIQGGENNYILIDTLTSSYHGINMKDSLSIINSFTLSCWIYLTSEQASTGGIALFSIADTLATDWVGNMEIFLDGPKNNTIPIATHIRNYRGDEKKDFWIAKDNTPEIYLTDVLNKWTHLVFRYSGISSTMTYFKDGEKVVTKRNEGFGALQFRNVSKMAIGAFQNTTSPKLAGNAQFQGWEKNFPGKIDQFRFYNQFLTDGEVEKLYQLKQ